MKRFCVAVFLFSMVCLRAGGQNFQRYNLADKDWFRYNPARIAEDSSAVYTMAKYSFVSNEFYAENPLDIAVGATYVSPYGAFFLDLSHDGYSYYGRHGMQLGYAYSFKLPRGRLSIGAAASLWVNRAQTDKLPYPELNKGVRMYYAPDLSLGLEWTYMGLRVGLGAANVVGTKSREGAYVLMQNPRAIMACASYDFSLPYELHLKPMLQIGFCSSTSFDLGLGLGWRNVVDCSVTLRAMELIYMINAGVNVPGTKLSFTATYTRAILHSQQFVSAGICYRLK